MWSKDAARMAHSRSIEASGFTIDSKRFFTYDGRVPAEHAVAYYQDPGSGVVHWDVKTGALVKHKGSPGDDLATARTEYEKEFCAEKGVPKTAEASQKADLDWESRKPKSTTAHGEKIRMTSVKVEGPDGRISLFQVSGLLKEMFRLPAQGTWVVISDGATAPSKLSVVSGRQ